MYVIAYVIRDKLFFTNSIKDFSLFNTWKIIFKALCYRKEYFLISDKFELN